jgi:hypothetical protein
MHPANRYRRQNCDALAAERESAQMRMGMMM